MREGNLEAPTRHVIPWEDPAFSDRAKTQAEMHRVSKFATHVGDASIFAMPSRGYSI